MAEIERLTLHPVIRLIFTVLIATAVTRGSAVDLFAATGILVVPYIRRPQLLVPAAISMLKRLRWFFFSLLVLFFWFTPGTPLLDLGISQRWIPTREGLVFGSERTVALVLVVLAVNYLLRTTSREHLLLAIYFLTKPLSWTGTDLRERFAVRLALVLETVGSAQSMLSEIRQRQPSTRMSLNYWGRLAGSLVRESLAEADAAALTVTQLRVGGAPPWWQWAGLVFIGAVFLWLR